MLLHDIPTYVVSAAALPDINKFLGILSQFQNERLKAQ